MQKILPFCHRMLGLSLHASLILFLGALPFGKTGLLAAAPAFLVLIVFIVLESSLRLGGKPRRIRSFLHERISGCVLLAILLAAYLICGLVNLSYSPIKQQMLSSWPIPAGGVILWIGILYYVDDTDRLDNLLMDVTAAGIALSIASVAGVRAENGQQAMCVIFIGLFTGAMFFLSAQYNKTFKSIVSTAFFLMMAPALWGAAGWAAPAVLTQGISTVPGQGLMRPAFSLLNGYRTPEVLLGRGSGYDIAVSQSRGVCNFLLADLLNGGVVRFALGLAIWLCLAYCVGMLFLYQKGMPLIYLASLGLVLINAFFFSKTGFITDPLFIVSCALIVAEHTMIKKGKRHAAT